MRRFELSETVVNPKKVNVPEYILNMAPHDNFEFRATRGRKREKEAVDRLEEKAKGS